MQCARPGSAPAGGGLCDRLPQVQQGEPRPLQVLSWLWLRVATRGRAAKLVEANASKRVARSRSACRAFFGRRGSAARKRPSVRSDTARQPVESAARARSVARRRKWWSVLCWRVFRERRRWAVSGGRPGRVVPAAGAVTPATRADASRGSEQLSELWQSCPGRFQVLRHMRAPHDARWSGRGGTRTRSCGGTIALARRFARIARRDQSGRVGRRHVSAHGWR